MKRCHLCRGKQVADLVREATPESPEFRQPICEFHRNEIIKSLANRVTEYSVKDMVA